MAKKIKRVKIDSLTSMNTLLDEISNGSYYRYVRTDQGTFLSCKVNLELNEPILVLDMNLLVGTTLTDAPEDFDHYTIFHKLKNMSALLADFHRVGLFHRDIKGDNIFMLKDDTSRDGVKFIFIDLAFSSWKNFETKYKGTKKFMPDE